MHNISLMNIFHPHLWWCLDSATNMIFFNQRQIILHRSTVSIIEWTKLELGMVIAVMCVMQMLLRFGRMI